MLPALRLVKTTMKTRFREKIGSCKARRVTLFTGNYSELLWCTTRHLWPDLHTYF